MCRFLVTCADLPLTSYALLEAFAAMAEASRSPDGDRQDDGWGAAWLDGAGRWQRHRSLAPIWLDRAAFAQVPPTPCLVVHARSASFPETRRHIERCQPFLLGRHVMVFNGLLRKVALPASRPGLIGAQRLAALLGALLTRSSSQAAVDRLWCLLRSRSASLPAVNLALTDGRTVEVLAHCEASPEYYQLWVRHDGRLLALASEPLDGSLWQPLPPHHRCTLRRPSEHPTRLP